MQLFSFLTENIIETDCLQNVMEHVSSETLVLCDLDNTLIEAGQHLGSVQWGEEYKKRLIESGKSVEQAEEIVHQLWLDLLPTMPTRLVDEKVAYFFDFVRQKGGIILGLTSRGFDEAPFTHPQLKRLGIRFDERFADQKLFIKSPIVYENGILFCGWAHKKSEALLAFLRQINHAPQKVVFIDDKLSHVQDLENCFALTTIKYTGIRLSKTDQRVQTYQPQLADIQLKLFPIFVTDEEALQLLNAQKI